MKFFPKLALWFLKRADERTKRDVLREAVKDLFCTISADDILKTNEDGTLSFEGKTLDPSMKKNLREQAHILEGMLLWKVLKKDIEYQLRRRMFEDARIDMDVVWGQLLTFLYDIIKTRLERLKNTQ